MSYSPPHLPTDASRETVSALYVFGVTQEDIAKYLDICVETLVKCYKRELETALVDANRKVANRLYNKATEQDDFQAQRFWLQTRGRWRTADKVEETKEAQSIIEKLLLK